MEISTFVFVYIFFYKLDKTKQFSETDLERNAALN